MTSAGRSVGWLVRLSSFFKIYIASIGALVCYLSGFGNFREAAEKYPQIRFEEKYLDTVCLNMVQVSQME